MENAAQKIIRVDDFDVYVQRVQNIFHSQKQKHHLFKKEKCNLCSWIEQKAKFSQKALDKDFYLYKSAENALGNPEILLYKKHILKDHERIIHYLLSLADAFSGYCVLYDGTEIEDKQKKHFYFQKMNKRMLPVVQDLKKEKYGEVIYQNNSRSVYMLKNYICSGFLISSTDLNWVVDCFNEVEKCLGRTYSLGKFPYLNLIVWKDRELYKLFLAPRVVHRPSQYYARDSSHLNIEPGAADIGGCVLAYSDDVFNKMNVGLIKSIYQQISYSSESIRDLVNKFVYP